MAAAATTTGFWTRAVRAFNRLRMALIRALTRAKDLQAGAEPDTRTGEGRQTLGLGGRSDRDLNHPVLSSLRWRAACELLEYLGGLTAPRQLRAHVDSVGDPAKAMEMLVEDLGCDLEKLKAQDPEEQDLFLERLETLVSLDRLMDTAPAHIKELVVHLFHNGNLARLRELSETRRDLVTAIGLCDDIRKHHRMAAVEKLRTDSMAALDNVENVERAFAAQAVESATIFLRVADDLAHTISKWTATKQEATLIWPAAWSPLDHPQRKLLGVLERRASGILWGLSANGDLAAKAAEASLDSLKHAIEELETLLAAAHEEALHGHKRQSSSDRDTRRGPQSKDQIRAWLALLNLPEGDTPTREALNAAYRLVMKKLYPKVNAGDRHAEELVKHVNVARDKIKAFYGLT